VPAKVNLHLGVGPLRADGFHELVTVFQAVSVTDELVAEPGPPGVALTVTGSDALPVDQRNLAVRAVRALAAHAGVQPAVTLHLTKRIPVAGGMAGGSADAAAALVACDVLWRLGTPVAELHALAAQLGSDVPFALLGGVAVGTGRGERLTAVPAPHRRHWVVAVAEGGLSTPAVYAEADRLRGTTAQPTDPAPVLAALADPDPGALGAALANDLQPAALALRPALAATLAVGRNAGALGALVCGSGPSCAFLAADAADADRLARALVGHCRVALVAHGPVPGAAVVTT